MNTQLLIVGVLSVFLLRCGGQGADLPPPLDYPPAQKLSGMTWYKDVEPIVQQHCQGCHTEGGLAPFSLTTYDAARSYAELMSSAVQARRMPPWLPAAECGSFRGSRALSQEQIDVLFSWAADQAPAGDPRDNPPPTPVTDLPWTDVALNPGGAYQPPDKALTDYHCFLLDPHLERDQDLIGFAVQPGQRQMVHHVLLFPVDAAEARALDSKAPGVGWTCFGGPGTQRTATVGGWVPGSPPVLFPEGTGIALTAGQVLVMQIHYDNHGGGAWGQDRTTVKLQYARQPVIHAQVLPLLNNSFSVPPGAENYPVTATKASPLDGVIHGLQPHAHQQARRLRVTMGESCLIDLVRWDFSWQQMYFYQSGLPVRRGAQIQLTCVFDNPGADPLRWGESTTDEMCLNYVYVTPR